MTCTEDIHNLITFYEDPSPPRKTVGTGYEDPHLSKEDKHSKHDTISCEDTLLTDWLNLSYPGRI